jgi:hypothetical protein
VATRLLAALAIPLLLAACGAKAHQQGTSSALASRLAHVPYAHFKHLGMF